MATYLITQATGQQSQWVISHLLEAGAKIHAVVRDLTKAPPALKKEGITLFQGDSTNLEEVFQAAQGCKGAFLNTFPWPGLEGNQARTIVAACEKAGVESIVAATTFTLGNRALWDVPSTDDVGLRQYWESKIEVEDAVRAGKFKAYTILRPAVIHFDFMVPGSYGNFPGLADRGELGHAINEGRRVPFTDANDVGKYAAAALLDPARFAGEEIDLANENLSSEEVHDILERVSGKKVGIKRLTRQEADESKVFGLKFQLWANAEDFDSHLETTKKVQDKFGMPFTSLEAALQRDKARLVASLP